MELRCLLSWTYYRVSQNHEDIFKTTFHTPKGHVFLGMPFGLTYATFQLWIN